VPRYNLTLTDHLFRLVEGWAESWSAKVKMADRDLQLHTEIREPQLALLDLLSRT
jgi:hypothetical protein